MAGKIKFQQVTTYKYLDVMLSMDSGNAHIAAMLGVKVILWVLRIRMLICSFNQPLLFFSF
jgi:hypothetical protein